MTQTCQSDYWGGGSDWHLRTQWKVISELLPELEWLYSDSLADSVTCYQEHWLTQTTYHQNETYEMRHQDVT